MAAYGFKDEKLKYQFATSYSLNNKSIYRFPQNYIRASFQRDTKIPGQELQFAQEDNFLLSFKRGKNDKYLYYDAYRIDYVSEFENHLSYKFGLRKLTQTPAGSLFPFHQHRSAPIIFQHLTTSEVSAGIRYAPHEQYYQGKLFRAPIINQYPILSLDFTLGLKNVLGGEYGYRKFDFRGDKRFYIAPFGFADVVLEGSKTFGQVPYPLLNMYTGPTKHSHTL
jgi:hypothetical protein